MRKVVLSIFLLICYTNINAEFLKIPDYDPFKQTEKILKKHPINTSLNHKKEYILYAIYDNKVDINGKFYILGDRVDKQCTLWKIMQKRVLLQCKKKIKTVEFLTKKTYQRVEAIQ